LKKSSDNLTMLFYNLLILYKQQLFFIILFY